MLRRKNVAVANHLPHVNVLVSASRPWTASLREGVVWRKVGKDSLVPYGQFDLWTFPLVDAGGIFRIGPTTSDSLFPEGASQQPSSWSAQLGKLHSDVPCP